MIRSFCLAICFLFPLLGFSDEAAADRITAEVDWLVELGRGGATGIALYLLAFVMITITIERLVNLKSRRIVPPSFTATVRPLWHAGKQDEIAAACDAQPSTIARMTRFILDHREAPVPLLTQGASDIANRELATEQKKSYALAVIAGLAPLLGLLGTIIGMIESFKLVEIYGDDGGATILAGSISKALITTALGLIIAIPSLALFHYFRFRVQTIGKQLDEEMESLVNAWLLKNSGE